MKATMKLLIMTALNSLTDEERFEIISEYCDQCGSTDPECKCWDDDE